MFERIAVLVFKSVNKDKNYVLRIKDVKEETSRAELEGIMDYIITNNIFNTEVGKLTAKASCKLETINTTTMDF